jgi:Arc/MetJ-type ribon-helix-helix transcriptional regulator
MTVELKPEIEALIQKRLESGAFASPEEVIKRALELFDQHEWLAENRDQIATQIQEGWDEAQRGELIHADQVGANMQKRKQHWAKQQRPA